MYLKILIGSIVISSLFGYLEWGQGYHAFLYQVEIEFFSKLFLILKIHLKKLHFLP